MASSAIQAVKKELDVRLPQANVRAIGNASKANEFNDMLGVFQSNPPARGTTEMLQSYATMPWLRAVVDKVGSSVATTTWRVFVKTKNTEKGKRAPVMARQIQNMRHDERRAAMVKLKEAGELVEIEEHPLIDAL